MSPPRKGRAAALMVSLAVMASRMFGLVRELVFAAMFGAGKNLDAFLAAFQIPNLLRDLFAEGALSTAFTTIFAKKIQTEGDESAWQLGRLMLSTMILLLGATCLLGVLLSPQLVNATSFGFHAIPGKYELTVTLTRILFPFILFVSLSAAIMGMLNARFVFGIPALSPLAFNAVSVFVGVGLAFYMEPQSDWRHPVFTSTALMALAVGALLGGLAQLCFQLPELWRQGFRYRWRLNFSDPGLRAVWHLMWPALITASVVEINILVNGQFASTIDGARSWLSCAFRIVYFPIGMFGVAIATVLLPSVARFSATHDRLSFSRHVEEALRLSLYLTIPTAVGLFVLAPDIIRLIYERMQFDAAATAHTADALRAYTFGLTGYACNKVLFPCFHALGKPKIPLRISLLAVGFNLILNIILTVGFHLGHVGVASATSGVALLNFVLLAWFLHQDVPLGLRRNWTILLITLSTAAMACGGAAWLALFLLKRMAWEGILGRLVEVGGAVAAGALAYALITWLAGLPESRTASRLLLKKIRPQAH
jgi:putative peptidoglycan lipid II flippase